MYIDGGNNGGAPPMNIDSLASTASVYSGAILAELYQIPNQPLVFYNDGIPRKEDGIIAFTWAQFLKNTSNPNILARLPMTKAAVRAMDTVQSFVSEQLPNLTPIQKFVVFGGYVLIEFQMKKKKAEKKINFHF